MFISYFLYINFHQLIDLKFLTFKNKYILIIKLFMDITINLNFQVRIK